MRSDFFEQHQQLPSKSSIKSDAFRIFFKQILPGQIDGTIVENSERIGKFRASTSLGDITSKGLRRRIQHYIQKLAHEFS